MSDHDDAPVITSATPGSFAWTVLAERHPALIERVRDAFPYPPDRGRALDALLARITAGVIEPLPAGSHDEAAWTRWSGPHVGRSWFEVPFLWAESYFYRELLGAVGYFEPGPWQGIDPFAPFKRAESHGAGVAGELAALDALPGLSPGERDRALLLGSLWGNKADLGFRMPAGDSGDPGDPGDPGDDPAGRLLVDDSEALWDRLNAAPQGTVHLVADNAGRELIPDLVLIDHLLSTGRARAAVLHVKPYPYYVSDATPSDVLDCLRRVIEADGRAGETGARLRESLRTGRLALRAHPFFCAPFPYAGMPAGLRADFAGAALTLFKGDLNYRRLTGDRHWPPTTPFASVTSYFPGPLFALRTLKSDVVTGLSPRTLATLDATGSPWRTTGTYGMVQGRG